MQGLAQALFEEAVYDEDGNLSTSTLADYLVPAASRRAAPSPLGHTVTPRPTNPLGVKGIGEAGTIGAAPAVINAVVDALSPPRRHATSPCPPRPSGSGPPSKPPRPGRCRVIPAAFDYVRAGSADEALSLLIAEHGDEAKLLAGGHSLLPLMKLRLAPAGGARRHRPRDATCRTSATPATTSPSARSPATATSRPPTCCKQQVPLLAHAAGAGRRPAGAPPRHDRRLDRARRPGVGPARRRARARRHVGGRGPRAASATIAAARLLHRASSSRRSRPTSCSPRSACRRSPGAGWSFQKFNRRAQDWAIVGVAAVAATARRASPS